MTDKQKVLYNTLSSPTEITRDDDSDNGEEVASAESRKALLLKHARIYMKQGWAVCNVPPVYEGNAYKAQKGPRVTGWTKTRFSYNDLEEKIKGEINGVPENLVIVCGEMSGNLVVIDVDSSYAQRAWPVIREYYGLATGLQTFKKSTPNRGHWFYVVDEPVRKRKLTHPMSSEGRNSSHVDILGNGACAMVPASIHPDTGETVQWRKTETTSISNVNAAILIKSAHVTAAAASLGKEWSKLEGKHNDVTMAVSGAFAQNGYPLEEALMFCNALCAAAEEGKSSKRIQTFRDTYDKYNNGQQITGQQKLKELLPEKLYKKISDWLGFKNVSSETTVNNNHDNGLPKWKKAPVKEWMLNAPPPKEWIIPNVLQKGIVFGIGAPGGTGKSMLSLMIAASVASGKTLLPALPPKTPMKVMIILSEDPEDETQRRLHSIGKYSDFNESEIELLYQNLILCPVSEGPLLIPGNKGVERTEHFYSLKDEIEEIKPGLLILDPKSRMTDLDENSNNDATQFVVVIGNMVRAVNGSAIITHHVSKVMRNELNVVSVRGASSLGDGCRSFWNLIPVDDKSKGQFNIPADMPGSFAIFANTKANYTAKSANPIVLRQRPEHEGVFEQFDSQPIEKQKEEAALNALVNQLKLQKPVSLSELKYRRNENAISIYENTLSEARVSSIDLDKLVAIGQERNLITERKEESKGAGRRRTVLMAVPNQN